MASQIVRAAINGIENALAFHCSSAVNSPWKAPEYMFTVFIAREISRMRNDLFVDMECGVKTAISNGGGWGPGAIPPEVRRNGRIDIVLSRKNNTSLALVEVKKVGDKYESIFPDIRRICAILNRHRTKFKYGVLALFVSGHSSAGTQFGYLEDRIEKFEHHARHYASQNKR